MTDLLGELRHISPFLAHLPRGGGALTENLTAGERAAPRAVTTTARGPPGRDPASLPVDRTWQATGPRAVVVGRFRPNTVRRILNRFQLFLIPENSANFQNS
jgi:hypothetical protein